MKAFVSLFFSLLIGNGLLGQYFTFKIGNVDYKMANDGVAISNLIDSGFKQQELFSNYPKYIDFKNFKAGALSVLVEKNLKFTPLIELTSDIKFYKIEYLNSVLKKYAMPMDTMRLYNYLLYYTVKTNNQMDSFTVLMSQSVAADEISDRVISKMQHHFLGDTSGNLFYFSQYPVNVRNKRDSIELPCYLFTKINFLEIAKTEPECQFFYDSISNLIVTYNKKIKIKALNLQDKDLMGDCMDIVNYYKGPSNTENYGAIILEFIIDSTGHVQFARIKNKDKSIYSNFETYLVASFNRLSGYQAILCNEQKVNALFRIPIIIDPDDE